MNVAACDDRCWEAVTFCAGPHRMAVEAAKVRHLDAETADDGREIRVETLLGLAPTPAARLRRLRLWGAEREIVIAGGVEITRLGAHALYRLPKPLAVRARLRGLKALGFDERGMILVVDPDLWDWSVVAGKETP